MYVKSVIISAGRLPYKYRLESDSENKSKYWHIYNLKLHFYHIRLYDSVIRVNIDYLYHKASFLVISVCLALRNVFHSVKLQMFAYYFYGEI